MKPAKPRVPSSTRLLRVGRVISEVRSLQADARVEEDAPEVLAKYWQSNESRVKDDMIETLTVKIAQCTRENEHLKRAKALFDEHVAELERSKSAEQSELSAAVSALREDNARLEAELHRAQLMAGTTQEALQLLKVEFNEYKRHAERGKATSEQRELAAAERLRACHAQLAFESSQWEVERTALLGQLESLGTQLIQMQTQTADLATLHDQLTLAKASNQQLQTDLVECKAEAANARESLRASSEKKNAVDAKAQALLKMVREENAKVAELQASIMALTERLSDADATVAALQKDVGDWKQKYKQANTHANKLTVKLAHEERAKSQALQAVEDIKDQLEKSEKRCIDHSFQLKQAQEQCKYLASLKNADVSIPRARADEAASHPDSDAPSWMRE
ncbi:hypothetical protein ACHHYP_00950 [Achlya hypogyna]|uniref:Uncharacterized protein n=1 Tax=Achlya hypogyna TaxID=1202772 RepID=A0A1V9Z9R3_ACHHY|nr:hypothetical protein ACHHYP_00950 [Achlya hypogyna]